MRCIKTLKVKIILVIEILFFSLVITREANAQFVKAPGENIYLNTFFVTIGAEPEIITSVGYLHKIGRQSGTLNYQLGGSIKLAPIIISNGSCRANFLAIANWKMSEQWQNSIAASMYIVHDHNREGRLTGTGFELRANPAYVGKRWSKGFDIRWQYTPFTHIKHSEEAKETFDDRYSEGTTGIQGPKDGWYKNAANRVGIGITGTTNVGNHSALQISLGSLFIIQKQGILLAFSHAQIPAYLELSYRRW